LRIARKRNEKAPNGCPNGAKCKSVLFYSTTKVVLEATFACISYPACIYALEPQIKHAGQTQCE
jgi:hypothetical protein